MGARVSRGRRRNGRTSAHALAAVAAPPATPFVCACQSRDNVFKNTFKDIETILALGKARGTKFEFECYDTSHLYNLAHFLRRGLVEPPLFVQTVFGVFGGIGTHPDDLAHMKRTADRLFGDQYVWSVMVAGKAQIPLTTIGAAQGANVRVGLEDSLWLGPGELATNAGQVRKIREVLSALSLDVATPDEARAASARGGYPVRGRTRPWAHVGSELPPARRI